MAEPVQRRAATDRRWDAAQAADRLFTCARCGELATVHAECDHGHRYCSTVCSEAARADTVRRASARYQVTVPGRAHHAARQAAYRRRRADQHVTHHGVAPAPTPEPLPGHAVSARTVAPASASPGMLLLRPCLLAPAPSRAPLRCCIECGEPASDRLRRASLRDISEHRRDRRRERLRVSRLTATT